MAWLNTKHPLLSRTRQCGLLGLNRSSLYYKPRAAPVDDGRVLNEIRDIWQAYPFYGGRRIQAALARKGMGVNLKKVRRLMDLGGIRALYPKPKTSAKGAENRKYPYLLKKEMIDRPNAVWATDITYIKVPQGWSYLIAVMDVHSRYILSWRLSNSLSAFFCLDALNEALDLHPRPDIFNTDQGAQFTSDEWIYTLVNWGIRPSMTGVGRCLDNVYPERFWRSLKYENAYIYGYDSLVDARQKIGDFIEFYNQERLHQSLCYQTPAQVYRGGALGRAPDGYVDSSLDLRIELSTYPQALSNSSKTRSQIFLK